MFHAKMASIRELKIMAEATRDFVDVANFKLSGAGLSFQAVDSSRTALAELRLGPKAFLEISADRETKLGIKLENLFKVLRCIDSADSLEIRNMDNDKHVELAFADVTGTKSARFELSLIQKMEEDLDMLDNDYAAQVILDSEEFGRITRDLLQMSEDVLISVSKNQITLAIQTEFVEGRVSYQADQSAKMQSNFKIRANQDVSSVFPLQFLSEFCRAKELSDKVHLSFKVNGPMTVEFPIQNYGSLKYFLAPKLV